MAQTIGFWENNKEGLYDEGPFVLCIVNGYRLEVDGGRLPIMPDSQIMELLRRQDLPCGKYAVKDRIEQSADWLNEQYRKGNIVKNKHGVYVPDWSKFPAYKMPNDMFLKGPDEKGNLCLVDRDDNQVEVRSTDHPEWLEWAKLFGIYERPMKDDDT